MKLQSMTIIFLIVILPITLVLSSYIQKQVKTLNYQISYDSKLYTATYDAIKAFQLNTMNNTESDLTNSKMRDIQAAVNTFFNSVASNFGLGGYNKDTIQQYVPAIVFTMYDGYYIYSPYEKICNKTGVVDFNTTPDTIYGLKPYVYYSCRYKYNNNDFVITYSLDNYIKIQGSINGNWVNDAGYVIDYNNVVVVSESTVLYRGVKITKEKLYEYVGDKKYQYAKVSGTKYYYDDSNKQVFYILNGKKQFLSGKTTDSQGTAKYYYENYIENNANAQNYYKEAKTFTEKLIGTYNLSELQVKHAYITDSDGKSVQLDKNSTAKVFNNIGGTDNNTIVEPNSNFNLHRLDVIKNAIQTNLSTAIAGYNNYSGNNVNFQMPKLKETEWELVLNNICAISFLQGMNIGGKVYNGYSIIPNNKTKEVVTENSIYITASDGYYYQVMDSNLLSKNNLTGYFNLDFEISSIEHDTEKEYYYSKAFKEDSSVVKTYLGSYSSIVGKSGISGKWNGNVYVYLKDSKGDGTSNTSTHETEIAKAYYTALGRERYGMNK